MFQCQFASAKTQTFVGGVTVGNPGTIPFGLSSPLNPAGSCPANPNGPIPDGQQLVDITQNPGPGGAVSTRPVLVGSPSGSVKTSTPAISKSSPTSAPSVPTPQAGGFKLQNGEDAQKLNAQFATLTENSSCTGRSSCFSLCNHH